MAVTVTILLVDKDHYFAEGLRRGVSQYFSHRKINAVFTESLEDKRSADIVFLAKEPGSKIMYGYNVSFRSRQCVFMITEGYQAQRYSSGISKDDIVLISRTQSLETVLKLIDQTLLKKMESYTLYGASDDVIKKPVLTCREYEVMNFLCSGLSNHVISLRLHLSEKTVSTHKRNAMRKLRITQNTELNYWLLNGGLNMINVSST